MVEMQRQKSEKKEGTGSSSEETKTETASTVSEDLMSSPERGSGGARRRSGPKTLLSSDSTNKSD